MNLVEAEETGPIEGDDALVTPPRPPHRRVSISLLFTLTVLTATVVAIYVTFPARDNALMAEALARHHDEAPAWDLARPSSAELHAWAIAVVGKDPPIPANARIVGARETEVLGRRTAVVGLDVGGEPITYLVQYTRVISPEHSAKTDGDLRAVAWRRGPFTCVAVGHEASAGTWTSALGAN
jgi:hypothetical protein